MVIISAITKDQKVPCVLIGGFAVNHYKVSRQTADVDFLITEEDYNKISDALNKAGYRKAHFKEAFIQLKSRGGLFMNIDFMFVEKETLDKILKNGREISIAKKKFVVPSLDNLIALKLHSIKHNPDTRMEKDLPDIINLVRNNKLDFRKKKYADLCSKYGTKSIYNRILKFVP